MKVANDIREGSEAVFAVTEAAAPAAAFEAAGSTPTSGERPRPAGGEPQPPAMAPTRPAHDPHPGDHKLLALVQELQGRNADLARANSELNSLIASTGIGTLFLDGELRIRRYTQAMTGIFDLEPADVGRPFVDAVRDADVAELVADVARTARNRVAVEREWTGNDGHFYRVHMQPGCTGGREPDGVALSFVDISERERHDRETKMLNEQLESRKAFAESIIATVRDPMLVLDEDLRVVTASRAFYRAFKSRPEATLQEALYDLGEGQWNIPELRRLLDDVLPERTTVEAFEVRRDFGGGERTMLLNARRLRQQPGLEPLILLSFEDITERAQAAAALAASESKYRALFDSIDVGFCIIEMLFDDAGKPVDYRFLEVNPAFYRNTGLADAAGKTVKELVPDQEQYWFDIYGSVAVSGESARFEQRGEGMRRWFDVYAFRVGAPEQRRVAVLFNDVTKRKEQTLGLARLASIVDSSDDAIISKDLDGIVATWNKAAEEMFGYTADEATGRSIASLIMPADRMDEEDDILRRLRRGEMVDHFETVRRRKNGSVLDVSVTISPLRDKDGRIVGASKIARDVTERKRYERHRELLIQELNHRVKNTLASVQALAAQTFRGSGMREAVAIFEARLLAMSRAHDVLTRQSWQGAGIREVVGDAVAAWAGKSSERASFDGPELSLRPAMALALAMALHELATNAVKYGALSNKTGRVSIRWSVSDDARPCFHLHWLEQDGPPVHAPAKRGFGSRLIEYGLARDLGGTVELSFHEKGVECTIQAPLEEICEQGTV
jgi:two-component system CheB/CheR fusion protein